MQLIIFWAIGLYVLLLVGFYFFQEIVIIHPVKLSKDAVYSFDNNPNFKEINLNPESNITLNTLYFESETSEKKGIVLYFHGNADNLARWGKHAHDFTKHGYDVLMYDYRGFGKSTGSFSEEKYHQDAQFAYQYISKSFAPENIIIYGRSLGTGIATKLASENKAKMLILETPYYNFINVSRSFLPILPFEKILRYTFRTDLWITHVKYPIHIFHGTSDWVVPYRSSVQLVNLLQQDQNKILTTIEGGGHKNLADFELYHRDLAKVLK